MLNYARAGKIELHLLEVRLDANNHMKGFVPCWAPSNFGPGALEHDLVEHLPTDKGIIEHELQALGDRSRLRDSLEMEQAKVYRALERSIKSGWLTEYKPKDLEELLEQKAFHILDVYAEQVQYHNVRGIKEAKFDLKKLGDTSEPVEMLALALSKAYERDELGEVKNPLREFLSFVGNFKTREEVDHWFNRAMPYFIKGWMRGIKRDRIFGGKLNRCRMILKIEDIHYPNLPVESKRVMVLNYHTLEAFLLEENITIEDCLVEFKEQDKQFVLNRYKKSI